jgi:hypothetical protein
MSAKMYIRSIHSKPAAAREPPKSFRAFRVSCARHMDDP